MANPSLDLAPGAIIDGKYSIVRLIGKGSMGAVFEARNMRIGRRVAIKILCGLAAEVAEVDVRFEREAQVAGLVESDHIVEVLDLGSLGERSKYIVMEYLDGESLAERFARLGTLDSAQAIEIARGALKGIDAAHRAGIVHRDLKPDNIFILKQKAGQRDFVKVIDFGIARFVYSLGNVTMTGAFLGTPLYASPEQATGNPPADHRTDIYSMGVILYQAVTGRVPHEALNVTDLLCQIASTPPPPPRAIVPTLDPSLEAVILRAMARHPLERFQTALEFIDAMDATGICPRYSLAPPPQTARASAMPSEPEFSAANPAEADARQRASPVPPAVPNVQVSFGERHAIPTTSGWGRTHPGSGLLTTWRAVIGVSALLGAGILAMVALWLLRTAPTTGATTSAHAVSQSLQDAPEDVPPVPSQKISRTGDNAGTQLAPAESHGDQTETEHSTTSEAAARSPQMHPAQPSENQPAPSGNRATDRKTAGSKPRRAAKPRPPDKPKQGASAGWQLEGSEFGY